MLGLRIAQSFGEPTPYCLKVDGWVMGPNHRKGVSSDGHNGVEVEALEVLPRCLAPLDDDVRMLSPAVELNTRFQVDAVKHRFNCGDYSVEVIPLGLGLLHQHIKLCLGFMTIACKHYNVPSYKATT